MTLRDSNWVRNGWSLSITVPATVALLLAAISIVVTIRALSRVEETQQRNLQELSSAYLDGLSASLIPSVVREDVWEVYDILDNSRARYRGLNVQWVSVTNGDQKIIASSAPERFPPLEPMPASDAALFSFKEDVMLVDSDKQARMVRSLVYQNQEIGKIYAVADISALMAERSDVLRELVTTNAALTLCLAVIGYFAMRWLLGPVHILSNFLSWGRAGTMQQVPEQVIAQQSNEFRKLFENYNAMAAAVNEREVLASELAEEEKLASVGRLASGMAHEINNPLGGMLNALDSLKRYGAREEVRATSVRLLEEGLTGIRDLVRSTLTTYRVDQRPRDLTATDLDDLRLLIKPEARLRKLRLDWRIEIADPVHVPAVPVRDAILNLLLNACHTSPEGSMIGLAVGVRGNRFVADVTDTGAGLPAHMREYIERKGAGSSPLDRRSGLGLWIVKRHCDEMKGWLEILNSNENGTTIRLVIPVSGEFENAA